MRKREKERLLVKVQILRRFISDYKKQDLNPSWGTIKTWLDEIEKIVMQCNN